MSMMLGARGPSAEMNVTPMIDVLLVLIIIFLMLPRHLRGLDALVPRPPDPATHPQPTPDERTVVLELHVGDAGPTLSLDHEPVAWPDLQQRLFQVYSSRAERVLFIRADDSLDFQPVAQAIDIAHAAYADLKIGLLTQSIVAGPSTRPAVARVGAASH